MIAMQFIFFILGMFLDPVGIIMLTVPIFVPVVKTLGFDPLWFGILFVANMEMAYITLSPGDLPGSDHGVSGARDLASGPDDDALALRERKTAWNTAISF